MRNCNDICISIALLADLSICSGANLWLMTAPALPYSPSFKAGDLVFISGQIGQVGSTLVEGGFEVEVVQGFENFKSVLESNNLDVTNVVKTTVFLTDMADFPIMNTLYAEFFGSHLPARSTVAVKELPRGANFEIEAVAYAG